MARSAGYSSHLAHCLVKIGGGLDGGSAEADDAQGYGHHFLTDPGNGVAGLLHLRADNVHPLKDLVCIQRLFLQTAELLLGLDDLTLEGFVFVLPQVTVLQLLLCLCLRLF